MTIGKLTPTNPVNPVDGELTGYVRTRTLDLTIRTVNNLDKRSDRSPDLLLHALGQTGHWVDQGTGWWNSFKRKDGTSGKYLSITIQDPSMPEALRCRAFPEEGTNNWLIDWRPWRPRKPSAPMPPSPGTSGQASAT
jgi:uncharacterized protein (DUF736 family)